MSFEFLPPSDAWKKYTSSLIPFMIDDLIDEGFIYGIRVTSIFITSRNTSNPYPESKKYRAKDIHGDNQSHLIGFRTKHDAIYFILSKEEQWLETHTIQFL